MQIVKQQNQQHSWVKVNGNQMVHVLRCPIVVRQEVEVKAITPVEPHL
jgi:hypothetical protein